MHILFSALKSSEYFLHSFSHNYLEKGNKKRHSSTLKSRTTAHHPEMANFVFAEQKQCLALFPHNFSRLLTCKFFFCPQRFFSVTSILMPTNAATTEWKSDYFADQASGAVLANGITFSLSSTNP